MSEKLRALLEQASSFPAGATVIGPKTAQSLRDWLDAPWPALDLPTQAQVENFVSRLSLATQGRPPSTKEAGEMMDLFWRVLRRTPVIDLARGFDDLIVNERFMPGTAKVHAACSKYTRRREYCRSRARLMILRHEAEYVPPPAESELISIEDMRGVREELSTRFPSEREAG